MALGNTPKHIQLYSEKTFRSMLNESGLRVAKLVLGSWHIVRDATAFQVYREMCLTPGMMKDYYDA